jgi:hypothetical protein
MEKKHYKEVIPPNLPLEKGGLPLFYKEGIGEITKS